MLKRYCLNGENSMLMILFYIASAVALYATLMMITRLNAVHSLLYLILSLLAAGVIFFLLGAHFAAVLEVIIYAGAIMVLFIFVIMLLNQGQKTQEQERLWLEPGIWIGPSLLALILFAEIAVIIARNGGGETGRIVNAKQVGVALFGPYLLAVELASILLLAGLVGAYHLGKPIVKTLKPEEES
jgi:NADH-quinone oxidoreductase subunit J